MSTRPRPAWVRPGAVALDQASGQVGEVQHVGPLYGTGPTKSQDRQRVWLRPRAGGCEWESTVEDLRPAKEGVQ
jgi:hypothetical protein